MQALLSPEYYAIFVYHGNKLPSIFLMNGVACEDYLNAYYIPGS